MIKDVSFGATLRRIRIECKVTLRSHAKTTGLCPGNISKMERNLVAPPYSIDVVMKYLKGLTYSKNEYDLLRTAAVNHHIARVIARF